MGCHTSSFQLEYFGYEIFALLVAVEKSPVVSNQLESRSLQVGPVCINPITQIVAEIRRFPRCHSGSVPRSQVDNAEALQR